MTETVTVPRELLRDVLRGAEASAKDMADIAKSQRELRLLKATRLFRARIAELRKAAGLDE